MVLCYLYYKNDLIKRELYLEKGFLNAAKIIQNDFSFSAIVK